jgi:hypothetical protein
MRFDNVWRLSTAQALAVASVGGAAASSSAFGTQTYAIQLAYPGSTSSTGDCRIAIVSPNDNAVSSTAGTLLPPNWIEVFPVREAVEVRKLKLALQAKAEGEGKRPVARLQLRTEFVQVAKSYRHV